MKRFLSVILALMLLATMAVPAFATTNDTEPTATRTVEEILNEYHEKSFAAEMAEETGNSSVYSREASSGKSLEEETLDELRAAGYEAYHVTSSNYDALEESLKTDFEEMGLDPNGSYIITISGEPSGNARSVDPPSEDIIDDGGGGFLYYYAPLDISYRMRYVWVTWERQSELTDVVSEFGVSYANDLANYNVTGYVTSNSIYTSGTTLGTYRSLWGLVTTSSYSTPTLYVECSVDWVRKYIQIYDESVSGWTSATHSEYASTITTFTGSFLRKETSTYDSVYYRGYATIYSPNYGNDAEMKVKAVMSFTGINPSSDRTQEIQVKAISPDGTTRVLVTVMEWF